MGVYFDSLSGNHDVHLTNVNINLFVEKGKTAEDILKTQSELQQLAKDIYEKPNENTVRAQNIENPLRPTIF